MEDADLLKLLARFQEEGVQYILVGGHAVRLNGFVRATEDIDITTACSHTCVRSWWTVCRSAHST